MLERLGLKGDNSYEDWGFAETKEVPKRMEFWYRLSPQKLVPLLDSRNVREPRVVALRNPPPLVPGMVSVRLNGAGALRELLVIPSNEMMARLPDAGDNNSKSDTTNDVQNALLELAGLHRADFEPDPVKWTRGDLQEWTPPGSDNAYSLIPIDHRTDHTVAQVAEEEQATGGGAVPGITRVNIAELDGQIVFFHVVDAAAPTPQTITPLQDPGLKLGPLLSVLVTLIAMVLAWRNVLAGCSDLRGGRWLALFIFGTSLADSALGSVLTPGVLFTGLLLALASSVRFWIYYVALEPLARRFWPEMLVNWSRGLVGRVQDPGIGRDILYGMLIAILFTLFAFGLLAVAPRPNPQTLCGTRFLLAQLAERLEGALGFPLQMAVAMVLVRAVVRNQWLPVIAAGCFVFAWHPNLFEPLWSKDSELGPRHLADIVAFSMYNLIAGVLIARLGVLAASSFIFCHGIFRFFPWSADWGGPDLSGCVFAVVAILICALYGFYISVGRSSTFRNKSMNVA